MSRTAQRWCSLCGLPMAGFLLIGFVVAGFLPPPSPGLSADQITAMYRENALAIRIGLVINVTGSALLGPFVAVLSTQLKRVEGRYAPFAWAQLATGCLLMLEFMIPCMFMQAAAYRAERSPETVQALNDVAWFMFVGIVSTIVVQAVVIAVAILRDHRQQPVFPRWVGYFNLWAAVGFCPGTFCVFFKTGPFAWNGIFSWWVALTSYCIWLIVMTVEVRRAISTQTDEPEIDDRVAVLEAERLELRREMTAMRDELTRYRPTAQA